MKTKNKWFISNNEVNINKNIVNILPYLKIWYSPSYFLETGVYTPAFGIGFSWFKFNYYFTIQNGY